MWEEHAGTQTLTSDFNTEILQVKGFIESDEEARVSLAKFLRHNLSTAAHLIGGVDLYPVQHIAINAMFHKDFFLGVWGRGFSKTFTTAIFCFLYAIFNPGVKIGIISKSFRQSRMIFKQIEDFANSTGGLMLRQCISGNVFHKNDAWEMTIGDSRIVALPLGDGGKLRGWRFNCVVIDELLLMPENIINEVIKPFLAVQYKAREREKVRVIEDDLIKRGVMKESDRQIFLNNKLIGLSSASYKFENLYKIYENYEHMILGSPDGRGGFVEKKEPKRQYGIMQMSYEAAPPGLYNKTNIEEALQSMSEAQFSREYRAQFSDDSSGYFSMKKMVLCDIPDNEFPTIELKGDSSASYILAIDPNFDDSESSDHFAMSIFKMSPVDGRLVLVHQYAVAKSGLKDRIVYMHYLLTNFNIVYIILDHAGGQQFLDALNQSELFKKEKIELKSFDADFENEDYNEGLRNAKLSYNLEERRICHIQYFAPQWIRRANEMLQAAFDHKRIWFASKGTLFLESLMECSVPIRELVFDPNNDTQDPSTKMIDFVEHQDELMLKVKDECALIVITTTATGHQTFDLPQNLRRIHKPDKPRKDSYSALLLGHWAAKCYNDLLNDRSEAPKNTFIPVLLN